jgi:hypothetical protein
VDELVAAACGNGPAPSSMLLARGRFRRRADAALGRRSGRGGCRRRCPPRALASAGQPCFEKWPIDSPGASQIGLIGRTRPAAESGAGESAGAPGLRKPCHRKPEAAGPSLLRAESRARGTTHAKLERAQCCSRTACARARSPRCLDRALDALLARLEVRRGATTPASLRLPRTERTTAATSPPSAGGLGRDRRRCIVHSPTGRQRGADRGLEFDHAQPVAKGARRRPRTSSLPRPQPVRGRAGVRPRLHGGAKEAGRRSV